jgi:RNA polymerase sigma-70 factor (ECF subfamily)
VIGEAAEFEGLRSLDPQALTTIHDRYFPELYRYALYRLGDGAAAEDIAAETFVRLLESVKAGKGPHSSLRGWLMATASNLVNEHFRQAYKRRMQALPEEVQNPETDPMMTRAERLERIDALRLALPRLTA